MEAKIFTKKYFFIFIFALLLNSFWEIAHSRLYLSYQGGMISSYILVRAAFWDAWMILFIIAASQLLRKKKYLFIVLAGIALAVLIELSARASGRWIYAPAMPIIPFLKIGLTPTIQLALTGLAADWLAKKITRI